MGRCVPDYLLEPFYLLTLLYYYDNSLINNLDGCKSIHLISLISCMVEGLPLLSFNMYCIFGREVGLTDPIN